ncbi:MAG: hypothetical protein WC886_04775, partial [Saccharofermentanaceae bacterium]
MIHSYKFDDKNIVLDVFSGSIHLVDEVAYDVINLYESKSKAEIVDEVYSNYNASLGISRDDVLECISDVETL